MSTKSGKPLIVAAIPCFNEERFIGSVVLKVKKYVDKVIVIDDGSTDGSVEVARDAGASVRSHDCNKGYGAAIRTALNSGEGRGRRCAGDNRRRRPAQGQRHTAAGEAGPGR